ncbi:hypothetical protein A2U01_0068626, partial [Trifolium medium]|nr:hypothetical protein [Trifolium medium]
MASTNKELEEELFEAGSKL